MTILDMDRREKTCPTCGDARLIFITDAPKIRPVGKSVQYRCKACAIQEAAEAGDPLEVLSHPARNYLGNVWRTDRPPVAKSAPPKKKSAAGTAPAVISDAPDGKDAPLVIQGTQARRIAV